MSNGLQERRGVEPTSTEQPGGTGTAHGVAAGFAALPEEFQRVLALAQERNAVTVTPLDQLVGGWSGAAIHLVSVTSTGSRRVEHCILKLDRKRPSSRSGEVDRHLAAIRSAPPGFARSHLPDMAFEPVEDDGAVAIFYRIAGQSLRRFRPLSGHGRQSELAAIMTTMTTALLDDWNAEPSFQQAVAPRELLRSWLGFRLGPDGHLDRFLRASCRVDPEVSGFLVGGKVLRNPLAYARDPGLWGASRAIDSLTGFVHGDLNTNNVLLRFDDEREAVEGYYLIDLAAFQAGKPLLYDQRYLEMSYLLLSMAGVPFESTAGLISVLGDADVPDPQTAPVETAGPCAVIAAARRAFGTWVEDSHPSVQDDLWAQYWLAGVAAGLAYCHKPGLADEPRLAGLLYACANLERYAAAFPLPAPSEVRRLAPQGGARVGASPTRVSSGRDPLIDLPAQPTPFFGRAAELVAGRALLQGEGVRLVTLTGPGGIGKSRLALRLAADSAGRFTDGVGLVDLASARDTDQALAAIARAVGVRATRDRPLLDALVEHLGRKDALLLLDNFEQVMSAAPVVAELLTACPRLSLLVTSREALHVRGEHLLPVPVLPLPGLGSGNGSPEALAHSEAVRFFVERARAVQPDFRLTDENARAVAEICVRLDGLPLALELAAARVALLPPQALLERLGRPLQLLRGGARDLPARQQTLRDAIDWSYDLLDPGEQRLFALLSVFTGGTLGAIEAVAGAIGSPDREALDVLEGVTSLLDKSLLRPGHPAAAPSRVGMLETIRAYAAERLAEDPAEAAEARRAHAEYFADLAADRSRHLSGDEREVALRGLEADVENLRDAWRFWVAAGDLERLQQMTHGLWSLYDARGWYPATAALAADLLQVLGTTPSTPERARQEILLQTTLARVLLATKGFTPQVEAAYRRALELCRSYGDVPQLFPVLRGLASYYGVVAEFEKGADIGEQILALAEQQDDPGMRVEGHFVVATSLFSDQPRAGLDHLELAIAEYDPELYRSVPFRLGNDPGVPCYTTSALILWMLGSADRAAQRSAEALELAERLNNPYSAAYAAFHMGLLHLWRGEPERAEELALAGLRTAEAQHFEIWQALALSLRGAALADLGRADEGLDLIERGVGLYEQLRTPPVFWPLLLYVHAGACARAGRIQEGLTLLDEALRVIGTGSTPMMPDMLRLKGDLLFVSPTGGAQSAEPWIRRALDLARARGERALELRAAMSLSRMWRAQGKADEARGVLAAAYSALPEGFATADAREAHALLVGS